MFGGLESRMAQLFYAIPAVKGVEFGAGFPQAECGAAPPTTPSGL
jgi:chorismate synthase